MEQFLPLGHLGFINGMCKSCYVHDVIYMLFILLCYMNCERLFVLYSVKVRGCGEARLSFRVADFRPGHSVKTDATVLR